MKGIWGRVDGLVYSLGVERERNGQAGMTDDVRLEALKGPPRGRKHFLSRAGEITIGRDPLEPRIFFSTKLVSRRPLRCADRTALPSKLWTWAARNRTFVNGVAVADKVLSPGDQIRVGEFHVRATGAWKWDLRPRQRRGFASLGESATFVVAQAGCVVSAVAKAAPILPATARTVRDLKVLVDFSRALNAVEGVAALEEKVSGWPCCKASPAETCGDRTGAKMRPTDLPRWWGRARDVESEQVIPVSRTIF